MKIVVNPVSGCIGVDTPPMSHRSHVATNGSRPIAACSAAWIAPGTSRGPTPARSSTARGIVHHTARVSSSTGGSGSGNSSRVSFVETDFRT